MKPFVQILSYGVAVLGGFLVGGIYFKPVTPANSVSEKVVNRLDFDTGIMQKLESIESRLQDSRTTSIPPASNIQKIPIDQDSVLLEQIVSAINTLNVRVDVLSKKADYLSSSVDLLIIDPIQDLGNTVDWTAFDILLRQYQQDRKSANMKVQLMSPTAVIKRFGPPTKINRSMSPESGEVMSWIYMRDPTDENSKEAVSVVFKYGHVEDFVFFSSDGSRAYN